MVKIMASVTFCDFLLSLITIMLYY